MDLADDPIDLPGVVCHLAPKSPEGDLNIFALVINSLYYFIDLPGMERQMIIEEDEHLCHGHPACKWMPVYEVCTKCLLMLINKRDEILALFGPFDCQFLL